MNCMDGIQAYADALGVTVQLTALDSNGNLINIGTTNVPAIAWLFILEIAGFAVTILVLRKKP